MEYMEKLTLEEFIENANLQEEFVNDRQLGYCLQIYTNGIKDIQVGIELTSFSPLGINDIKEYEGDYEKFEPFAIAMYIEEHPDEDECSEIWEELYKRYLDELEEME